MYKNIFSTLGFFAALITIGFFSALTAHAQQRLVTTAYSPDIYAVADNGTKRWLQSPDILQSYEFSFGQVQTISQSAFNQIPRTKAIRLNGNPGVYLLTSEGTKHGIGSLDVLSAAGLNLQDVVSVNREQFTTYTEGQFLDSVDDVPITPTTNANLITTANNPQVYGVAANGTKRWLRTPAVLQSYGFNFSQVRSVAPPTITNIPNTKAIRLNGQPEVYRLNPDWTKQHITSPQVLSDLGLTFSDVIGVNQTEFDSYPTESALTQADQPSLTYRTYRNADMDFKIDYPQTMTANRTQANTVRFLMTGPTQDPNTEVTDGILVTIRRQSLQSMSLREYAQAQIQQPTTDAILDPIHPVTINGISGYQATIRSLGDVTHTFLPALESAAFHITYVNPDPSNQGYQSIVDRMLSTFGRL